jgi:hypothetical protein
MRKGDDNNAYLPPVNQTDMGGRRHFHGQDHYGRVTNIGDPLVGVVLVCFARYYTNANGVFSISADPGETLEFSFIGYKLNSIKIGAEDNVTIKLQSEVSGLNEIVVGYGTKKN